MKQDAFLVKQLILSSRSLTHIYVNQLQCQIAVLRSIMFGLDALESERPFRIVKKPKRISFEITYVLQLILNTKVATGMCFKFAFRPDCCISYYWQAFLCFTPLISVVMKQSLEKLQPTISCANIPGKVSPDPNTEQN